MPYQSAAGFYMLAEGNLISAKSMHGGENVDILYVGILAHYIHHRDDIKAAWRYLIESDVGAADWHRE